MTDTEKKIAEIREALEKATPGPWTKFENRIYGKAQPAVEPIICEFYEEETERDRNNAHLIANAPEWLRFLISELDRRDEENQKLRERLKEEIVWQDECLKLEEQLQSAQQEIKALRQERNKLIEGLRWYAQRNDLNTVSLMLSDKGQRARDILKECGVTVE